MDSTECPCDPFTQLSLMLMPYRARVHYFKTKKTCWVCYNDLKSRLDSNLTCFPNNDLFSPLLFHDAVRDPTLWFIIVTPDSSVTVSQFFEENSDAFEKNFVVVSQFGFVWIFSSGLDCSCGLGERVLQSEVLTPGDTGGHSDLLQIVLEWWVCEGGVYQISPLWSCYFPLSMLCFLEASPNAG